MKKSLVSFTKSFLAAAGAAGLLMGCSPRAFETKDVASAGAKDLHLSQSLMAASTANYVVDFIAHASPGPGGAAYPVANVVVDGVVMGSVKITSPNSDHVTFTLALTPGTAHLIGLALPTNNGSLAFVDSLTVGSLKVQLGDPTLSFFQETPQAALTSVRWPFLKGGDGFFFSMAASAFAGSAPVLANCSVNGMTVGQGAFNVTAGFQAASVAAGSNCQADAYLGNCTNGAVTYSHQPSAFQCSVQVVVTPTPTPAPIATPTPAPVRVPSSVVTNVPGRIETENYNVGGQGVGYNVVVSSSATAQLYRKDAANIEAGPGDSNGYHIGWLNAGSWYAYTINANANANFQISVRGGTADTSTVHSVHVEVDGVNKTGQLIIPVTGGWFTYAPVNGPTFALSAGQHTVKLVMDGSVFNIDTIDFVQQSAPAPLANCTVNGQSVGQGNFSLSAGFTASSVAYGSTCQHDSYAGSCNDGSVTYSHQPVASSCSVQPKPAALVSPAFFVSPSGNDSNNGSSASSPFQSLTRAQSAMQSSSTKTVYLMGGTYQMAQGLSLGGADNGETWMGYPGQTPILDGGNRVSIGVALGWGSANIQIRFLTLQNFNDSGIDALNSSGDIFDSNTIKNIHSTDTGHAAISGHFAFRDAQITHNLIQNCEGPGIVIAGGSVGENNSNVNIAYNAVYNTNLHLSDTGGIYIMDRGHVSLNQVVNNNIVGNFGVTSNQSGAKGIYLDDETSNVVVTNNIVYGTGQYGLQIHGGDHISVTNNIFDISQSIRLGLYQDDVSSGFANYGMASNVFRSNIVYSGSDDPGQLWDSFASVNIAMISDSHNLYSTNLSNSGPVVDASPLMANPSFANAVAGNYAVQNTSAASNIGFKTIDTSTVGPLAH